MRKIFTSMWTICWRLIWTVSVSFMILVGVLYVTSSTKAGWSGLSQAFQTAVNHVDAFLDENGIHTGIGQKVQNLRGHLADEHVTASDGYVCAV